MKKKIISVCLIICMLSMTGCSAVGFTSTSYQTHYQEKKSELKSQTIGSKWKSLGQKSAVIASDKVTSNTYSSVKEALLVNNSKNEVVEAQNIYQQAYPASTTKIMTALLTLENCNLNDVVTINEDIKFKDGAAVSMNLKKGDQITVESLLNGLLLMSANDTAVALARHISGSEKKFAQLMNQRAKQLGATHTHFVTSNGLHEANHYSTAYDLYLIFKELIKHNEFSAIAGQSNTTVEYKNKKNVAMAYEMSTTNHFILGDYSLPANVFMIAGKTGTTTQAGSCLILLTKNKSDEEFISVILKGTTKPALYETMATMLQKEN